MNKAGLVLTTFKQRVDFAIKHKRTVFGCVALCALTLFAFSPVLQNGFINYDDGEYITANPHVLNGLSWADVKWAFTTTRASNWTPLAWLSHMLDVQLFGVNPHYHHLVSLLIHTSNALLLFLMLQTITGAWAQSFLVAALFAVHPLHVESVVWASERKDLLSTLFFLLTIWAYAIYTRRRLGSDPPGAGATHSQRVELPDTGKALDEAKMRINSCPYFLSLAFYALGLMSKPMLVTVPFLLLLLDFWPLTRIDFTSGKRAVRSFFPLLSEKIPFLGLAVASCVATFLSQSRNYSTFAGLPLRLRLATAVSAYIQYLSKTVWPAKLSIFYPDPNARYFAPHSTPWYPVSELWPAWQIIAAIILLIVVSALILLRCKKEPWSVTGWFWYLGMLVPVIGVVQAGVQVRADHYTYLPLIGIFILCVWSLAELLSRYKYGFAGLWSGSALVLTILLVVTRLQVSYWRNDETVFTHALAVTSRNPVAEWMVGAVCAERGQLGLAQSHFRLALAADPYQVEARSALGSLFELENRPDLAIKEYETALKMKPQDEFARVRLGNVMRKLGKSKEALEAFKAAARWNPDSVEANYQAAALLLDAGDLNQAALFLQKALELKPTHAEALLCMSDLRAQQDRPAEAAAALSELVQLYPTNFELRVNLGSLLWKAGRGDAALIQYNEALRLSPSEPMIHFDKGTVLFAQGQLAEASREFTEALRLMPNYFEAAVELGRALAAEGKPKEAYDAFLHALQLVSTNAPQYVKLGNALLAGGYTNDANRAFARAFEIQPSVSGARVGAKEDH